MLTLAYICYFLIEICFVSSILESVLANTEEDKLVEHETRGSTAGK